MMNLLMMTAMMFTANAESNTAIKTDLKFLCAINKVEKTLSKDKSIDKADLAERIATMKANAFKDPATKQADSAISTMDSKAQAATWKQFAKDNKVKINCL